MRTKEKGFSLLELSVIVLILGLLTTLSWRFIAARAQQEESVATRSLLERADWALTGFVLSNHRLPCPAADENGLADCSTGEVGRLPYKTLGMADARAGRIRYGVLRRDTAADDPEADVDDPAPALSRNADLTRAMDRFYPLVGWAEGNFAANPPALPVLETENSDFVYSPVIALNRPLNETNGIDFCQALRVAEDPAPTDVTSHVHTTAGGTPRQVAYALALPGALDASGDNDLFDTTAGPAFGLPQGGQTYLNDDRVRAVSPGVLWTRLGCGVAVAAIGHAQPHAATAAAMLYVSLYDYEQVLEQANNLAGANVTIAASG
ncbi:MAG: hypothetical protein LBR95_00015, partial [Azoarcus sp.]|nr:hypothetical protein [Azoarcus sp.]